MFELTLNLQGEKELLLAFQLAELEFRDWRDEFRKLEPAFTVVIHRRFEQEGPGWLELTRVYAAQKARRYPGKTILRRSDKGYLSFVKGNEGNVSRIEPLKAEFGTAIGYMVYHQDKRPIIAITGEDERRFYQIMVTGKNERLRQIGFNVN